MDYRGVVKASEVTGVKVKNSLGDNLGIVNEIVIDKLSGKVSYLVLDFGGFMHFGNKFFAIPWALFHYDVDEGEFFLNIDKERLKDAPGFDKNNWPDFASADYAKSIDKFYE